MNRLPLKYRFVLLSSTLMFLFSITAYLLVYKFSINHHLSFLSQLMLDHQILFEQSIEDIKKLDIPESETYRWLESDMDENGFYVSKNGEETIYGIRKNSSGTYTVEIAKTSVLHWIQDIDANVLISFATLGLALGVFSFLYLFTSLKPLEDLRRATEDILAGRHDMSFKYNHNDEVGLISKALHKLAKDLEKKDVILEQYTELATTDGMTGLKNHRFFKENFIRELGLAKRYNDVCGLILLDVDHFKKFNDTYGHQQGDEVLKKVAQVLKVSARATDIVARYGGEEFVLVLPKTNVDGLKILGEKLRKSLAEAKVPYLAKQGEFLSVTASFGILSIDGTSIEGSAYSAFVENVDKNLYEAKRKGRNCVVVTEWKARAA